MSEITTSLVAQGPLGILCLLLIGAVVYLNKSLQACQECRLTEVKEIIKAIHESTASLNETTRLIQTAISMLKAQ